MTADAPDLLGSGEQIVQVRKSCIQSVVDKGTVRTIPCEAADANEFNRGNWGFVVWNRWISIWALFVASSWLLAPHAVAAEDPDSPAQPVPAVQPDGLDRATLGLDRETPDEAVPTVWNVQLTLAEIQRIERRFVQHELAAFAVEQLEQQDYFAGLYVEQVDDFPVVVLLRRELLDDEMAYVMKLLPDVAFRTRVVDRSATEWSVAANMLHHLWTEELDEPWVSVSVDLEQQALIVGLTQLPSEAAIASIKGMLGPLADVPTAYTVEGPDVPTCSRTACNPYRSGIQITRTGGQCTMGFHINVGSDKQFVTSGHCGHGVSPAPTWRHNGANIGTRTASMYPGLGTDIQRIQMPDSHGSGRVYGESTYVQNSRLPVQGEVVCASLGKSNTRKCGTVLTTNQAYTDPICGCTINGARANYTTIDGDSGSPVFFTSQANGDLTAIGVNSTASGRFAPVQWGLNHWGNSIATGK